MAELIDDQITRGRMAAADAWIAKDDRTMEMLSNHVWQLVTVHRDLLLTGLEAHVDRLQAAEREGDWVAVSALFPEFEWAAMRYRQVNEWIRNNENPLHPLQEAGSESGRNVTQHDTKDKARARRTKAAYKD